MSEEESCPSYWRVNRKGETNPQGPDGQPSRINRNSIYRFNPWRKPRRVYPKRTMPGWWDAMTLEIQT